MDTNSKLFIKLSGRRSVALDQSVVNVRQMLDGLGCEYAGPYALKKKRFSNLQRRQFAIFTIPDNEAFGYQFGMLNLPADVNVSCRLPLETW